MLVGRQAEFDRLLDRVDGIAAGVGEADDIRAGILRRQEKGREISRADGMADIADDRAASRAHLLAGRAFERLAECIVGCEKKPLLPAGFDERADSTVRERPGVVGPMEAVGRTLLASQNGRCSAGDDVYPLLLARQLLHRQRDCGIRQTEHGLDILRVVPFAREAERDIGLVLMIAGHDFDRSSQHLSAEIADRHIGRSNDARTGTFGIDPAHVVEHADAHGRLRRCGG